MLYLNAGDTSTGTAWYYLFKDDIATTFLNILEPNVIVSPSLLNHLYYFNKHCSLYFQSLGNHEFDSGISGLIPFLNKVKFPVVAANLDLSTVPQLKNANNLYNSTVLEVNNVKIGVIGYITPDTMKVTITKENIFTDEIKAIK